MPGLPLSSWLRQTLRLRPATTHLPLLQLQPAFIANEDPRAAADVAVIKDTLLSS